MANLQVQIAAQSASDAKGVAYPTYFIPDPKDYDRWCREQDALGKVPLDRLGRDGDVQAPKLYSSVELKRGDGPRTFVITERLLRHLKTDRKNLMVFGEVKVDAELGEVGGVPDGDENPKREAKAKRV